MAKAFFSAYPPYGGDEPYLYLCFHEADASRVKPLLELLFARGCRVWYAMGRAVDPVENRRRSERIKGADVMAVYLSARAAGDGELKSTLGYYQALGKPVISLETEALPPESGLGFLFTPGVQHITASGDTEALLSALLHARGFSQALMGAPNAKGNAARMRKTALILLSVSLAVLMGAFFYARSRNWFRPEASPQDTVHIADAAIEEAARLALSPDGSVPLTEAGLASVTTLRLSAAPSAYEALALFPSLERLEIPQSGVAGAQALLDSAPYTIVVYGEAGE